MKRILFDAYELAPDTGKSIGIYNYARHLFNAIVGLDRSDIELVLVCNGASAPDFSQCATQSAIAVERHVYQHEPPSRMQRLQWLALGAAITCRRLHADIYFSPKGFLPFGLKQLSSRTRTVVTIHDLIPLWYRENYPHYFGRLEEWFVCTSLVRSARKADEVVTISQASERDIRVRTGTRRQMHVIHNGIHISSERAPEGPNGYVFAIGSSLPHKNIGTLIDGYCHYRKLVPSPLRLLLCGTHDPRIEGIEVTGRLTDEELRACFRGASVFVFMSLVEGFGFPPLEAMSTGTPVICSDIEVHREIAGDAVMYVPPTDALALGRAIADAVGPASPALRALADRRRAVAQSYSWHLCAESFLNATLNKEF